MDTQTDTHTPTALTEDPDFGCFAKAKFQHEATFTLRAQDVTAPLTVLFWIKAQLKMREFMAGGLTMTEAVTAVWEYYFLDSVNVPASEAKLCQAGQIAEAMAQHPNRKLAD
jgi:hypothetical protein